jgi:hypothetical protein
MQANTLPNPAVRDNLTNFAYVALDLEPNQETAQRHNVSSIPAFLILTPDGDEVLRTEGYQDSALFNAWLDKAKAAFTAEQEKLAAFRKTQEAIAVNLYSTDPAVRHAARSDLFNLCADREPSHQNYAATQLRTLAARDPKSLLPGLEHSRLATRIAVANQLRDKFGSNFTFDPWANPDEREKAVLALKNSTDLEKPQQIEAERKE